MSRLYQSAVSAAGVCLWLVAALGIYTARTQRELLMLLALVPGVIIAGQFRNIFPLPSSLKFRGEKVTFTLSDAFILLVACWQGILPAVFVAGAEALISACRVTRRLSSILFSFSMMSLTAAASAAILGAVLRYGQLLAPDGSERAFLAVSAAILVASFAHTVVNISLLSALFALRNGNSIARSLREDLLGGGPVFLAPLTATAASSIYLTLQHGMSIGIVLGVPALVAIFVWHRQYRNSVQERINLIEKANRERIALLEKAHRETIEALAVTINAKDEVTHEHVLRVQIYAAGVARILGCSEAEIEALKAGALLHDIGKIAVPDYIISKPGKLTAAEFEQMKTHTLVGAQILGRVCFPFPIVPVVRHHHERWDGRGYPDGLKGEEIPLTARILSVVDCFDAVREDRQYRKGMTREEAIEYLYSNSGTQYDPRVVGTFITRLPEFEAEIAAHRNAPTPTFGIEPVEQLSEAARLVPPAAGLAEDAAPRQQAGDNAPSDEQLARLSTLAHALSAARTTDEAIASFTKGLRAVVPYDSCAVTLVPPHTKESVVAHADGQHAALLAGHRILPGDGVTGWVLANRQPFYDADPKLDLPPTLAAHSAAYRTMAAHPLMHGRDLHGVITLYSVTLNGYGAEHRQLLSEASRLLGATLAAGPSRAVPAAAIRIGPNALDEASLNQSPFGGPVANLSNVVLESELSH